MTRILAGLAPIKTAPPPRPKALTPARMRVFTKGKNGPPDPLLACPDVGRALERNTRVPSAPLIPKRRPASGGPVNRRVAVVEPPIEPRNVIHTAPRPITSPKRPSQATDPTFSPSPAETGTTRRAIGGFSGVASVTALKSPPYKPR